MVVALVSMLFFAPLSTKAVSIAELQAQVQALITVVASLQQQLNTRYTNTIIIPSSTAKPWWCSIYDDVSFGMANNRVMELHNAMGINVLGVYPTGYYGRLTYNAWQRWCGQVIIPPATPPVDPVANPANNPNCQSWYDGCNTCSRAYKGGKSMCTLMACYTYNTPYCKAYFNTTVNQLPTVSGFSGPTILGINQVGTWTLQASDPEGGQLTYSVTWGDEHLRQYSLGAISPMENTFTQSTSFTHQYTNAGTYAVSIVVRDNAGQEANTTTTVRVETTNVACTKEYVPVCGQPQFYCPPGAICAQMMPIQQTYGNICMLNAAGATLVHYGACY